MERLSEREDLSFACVERCNLQRILIRLRTTVAKEKSIVIIPADLSQTCGKILLQRILDCIGIESEIAKLLRDHLHIMRMAMAHRNHGMTSVEVGINLAILIPKCCVQALYRLNVP